MGLMRGELTKRDRARFLVHDDTLWLIVTKKVDPVELAQGLLDHLELFLGESVALYGEPKRDWR